MRCSGRSSSLWLLALASVTACSAPADTRSSGAPSSAPPADSPAAATGTTAAPGTSPFTLLPGSTHPSARPERDEGRLEPDTVLHSASIVFRPSDDQLAARDARLAAVQDPSTPVYHRWLTPEQYAARFGASPAARARVSAWLASQGFSVESTSRTGTQLFFTGTAAQVEQAFRTEMHWYRVDGERHFAMSRAPSIPADLAPLVKGLHNLHSFRLRPPKHTGTPVPDYNLHGTSLAPADFATIYDLTPLYAAGIDGTGMKVAIAGQTSLVASDYSSFRQTFGLSATQPDMILVPGSGTPVLSDYDIGEANIDTQWSGAVAKNATVEYVYTGNNPAYGVLDAYAYVVDQGLDIAPVVSISYGGCEQGESPADADVAGEIAAAGNLMGVTLLAASGDSGAADCDYGEKEATLGLWVDIPAVLPGVTGVGGTEFPKNVLSNTAYWSASDAVAYPEASGASLEAVWNDSQSGFGLGGGGGGKSKVFAKPTYQQGVTPADGARDVPDVALTASSSDAPYLVYDSTDFNGLAGLGGTSCAAPSFAGILTLANHAVTAKGGPLGLGNANPMLYALSQSAPTAFHDIVVGSNTVPCKQGSPDCSTAAPYEMGYSAVAGYDLASGLGSVDANVLVTSWAGLTPTTTTLTASAASTTVGTPVTLTATVASTGAASMTGDVVTFTFETYSPPGAGNIDGGFDDSWILGTVPVTATTAGNATATLSVAIPPGYDGNADVVAMFEGDPSYMASRSAKTRITVGGLTLAVAPLTATTVPSGTVQFTASGGTAPYRFYIESDSTFVVNQGAGTETAATVNNTGLLTAGPQDGAIALEVLDAAGGTVWMNVVVAGNAPEAGTGDDGGSTVDASSPTDASVTSDGSTTHDGGAGEGGIPLGDAGTAADAGGAKDSGPDAGDVGSGKSGCSCTVVASDAAEGKMGALGGLLAAAAFVRRRRRA